MKWVQRLSPLAVLGVVIACFYLFGGFEYLKVERLGQIHREVLTFIEMHPFKAALFFTSLYVTCALSSIPGIIMLDVMAGYLFGPFLACFFVIVGSALGGAVVFLAVKYAFYDFFCKKKWKSLEKIRSEFNKHPTIYLLFLRIVPISPFGLVNIALALMDIKLFKYVWTTALGLVPSALAYTHLGTGLGAIFDQNRSIQSGDFFKIEIIIALVGLGVISLTPILYKKYRKETS